MTETYPGCDLLSGRLEELGKTFEVGVVVGRRKEQEEDDTFGVEIVAKRRKGEEEGEEKGEEEKQVGCK